MVASSVGRITPTNDSPAINGHAKIHARLMRIMNGMLRMKRPSKRVMYPTSDSGGGSRMLRIRSEMRMACERNPNAASLYAHVVDLKAEGSRRHGANTDGLDALKIEIAELGQRHGDFLPVGPRNEAVHGGNGAQHRSGNRHHVIVSVAPREEAQRV